MSGFWLCFVPLFIAVDAVGVLPIFMSLTEGLDRQKIRGIVSQSVVTAVAVALLFLVIGKSLFNLLGITVADFMVAGGILLFIISMSDMLRGEKRQRRVDSETLGAVPLGVPLIVGPAVLTTALILIGEYGMVPTVLATILNVLIAGLVFLSSGSICRILGRGGAKTVSKIASLLLAAIAVMMVRKGVTMFLLGGFGPS